MGTAVIGATRVRAPLPAMMTGNGEGGEEEVCLCQSACLRWRVAESWQIQPPVQIYSSQLDLTSSFRRIY